MKNYIFSVVVLGFMVGCMGHDKARYDGDTLLEEKCASCHNLDMPPKTYEDEKAPPMMAISFHVKDFLKVDAPSEKRPKFIEFFQDFVLHPSREKSFCDKKSLEDYGLMPSQEGKVTKEEVGAIAAYVYDFYDQQKFLKNMAIKAKFNAMPLGEQIATHGGCFTCHDKQKAKVGPSFKMIATKSKEEIIRVIKEGSKGSWKGFERMIMPPYQKNLSQSDIESLASWIKQM
jgi:cytochrome c